MFKTVEKHQKLAKGILVVIGVAFAMWGIGGYLSMAGDDGYVAKVGGHKIYPRDIEQLASQNPSQSGDKIQLLFGLINRQLLVNNIEDQHMIIPTQELQDAIAKIPAFQEKGRFNVKLYTDFLSNRLMSADQFQQDVAKQMLVQQFVGFFKDSFFPSTAFNKELVNLLSRERNVAEYKISPQQFYAAINVTDKQIEDYYKQNIAKFTTPEKVKIQSITLNSDDITDNINVTQAEVDKYIHDHPSQATNMQMDVSHILFAIPSNASPTTKAAIKAHAEKILAKLKANPSLFVRYAKKYSDDKGSATKGGDLGYFSRGVMDEQFEKAALKLKPGQISNLVQTQYGYHILKLNAIKQNNSNNVRQFATGELRKQKATTVVQDKLEQLNKLTYNNAKTLNVAAQKLGLKIATSDWLNKGAVGTEISSPKVEMAIFTPDVIDKGNNSAVVDLGEGNYAVYRVIADVKPQVKPLEAVRQDIITALKGQAAANLVYNKGQQELAQIEAGKLQVVFTHPQTVNLLAQNDGIDPMAVKQIFDVSLKKLPAYTGAIDKEHNFVIYKIMKESVSQELHKQNEAGLEQIDSNQSMLSFDAYINYLREQYSISYRIDRLKNDRAN